MEEKLNIKNYQSLLVPFLVGGFVGAGIALLLAPKSGKELRKDIQDIAVDTRDKVTTTVEKGKELYVEGIESVKHVIDAGKTAYNSEMEKYRKVA